MSWGGGGGTGGDEVPVVGVYRIYGAATRGKVGALIDGEGVWGMY